MRNFLASLYLVGTFYSKFAAHCAVGFLVLHPAKVIDIYIYIIYIYMELCLDSLECNVYMWYVAGFGIGQAVPQFLFKSMPSATTYLHLCLIFLSIREQKTPGTFHCGRVQKDPPGSRKHHWTQKKHRILVAFQSDSGTETPRPLGFPETPTGTSQKHHSREQNQKGAHDP